MKKKKILNMAISGVVAFGILATSGLKPVNAQTNDNYNTNRYGES